MSPSKHNDDHIPQHRNCILDNELHQEVGVGYEDEGRASDKKVTTGSATMFLHLLAKIAPSIAGQIFDFRFSNHAGISKGRVYQVVGRTQRQ
mmetsp:Transcript_15971/g.36698  ORF Transcript_15971/g.36698 Transcript_15971/m.36698 type:complete len:92 (-) Transcript_15971:668-943(-)